MGKGIGMNPSGEEPGPRRFRLVRTFSGNAREMLREMARHKFVLVIYKPDGPTVYTNLPESQSVERMITLMDTPTDSEEKS